MSRASDQPEIEITPAASPPVPHRSVAIILTIGAVAFVFSRAWVCDDAFITFRHVVNCLAGHGPVFNPGERVQGFTHPLWFLILLAGSAFFPPHPLAMVLGLISTAAIMLLLARFLRPRRHGGLCLLAAAGMLLSSPTFIEYQTSGLETCLTHLLVAWMWAWLLTFTTRERQRTETVDPTLSSPPLTKGGQGGVPARNPTEASPSPAAIVLLCSLLMLDRPDHIVPCLPLLLLALHLLRRRGRREWLLALAAVLPLLAWYGFALVYYGTPLPNTAYAKRGIPLGINILHGLAYLRNYSANEPIHGLIIPVVLIVQTVIAVRDSRAKRPGGDVRLALVLAVWFHTAYVVLIGGDFMRGRFLSLRLVATAVLTADLVGRLSPARSWKSAFSLVMLAGLVYSVARAVSQMTSVDTIGPAGMYPALPLAFLLFAGLGIFVVTALTIARRFLPPGRMAACLLLAAAGLCTLFDFKPRTTATAADGIADEYAWYAGTWREDRFARPAHYPVEDVNDWVRLGQSANRYARQHGPITIAWPTTGFLGYIAGPQVHIVDIHGLTDPFIARLPTDPTSRIGHLRHDVPKEYLQARGVINGLPDSNRPPNWDGLPDWRRRLDEGDPTLAADARALAGPAPWPDAHLEERWKDIQQVIRGSLFRGDRWKLIPRYARGSR